MRTCGARRARSGGERLAQREAWAQRQLDALWDGKVEQVVAELAQQQAAGEGVTAALSFYTTHRRRMDYAAYRARAADWEWECGKRV